MELVRMCEQVGPCACFCVSWAQAKHNIRGVPLRQRTTRTRGLAASCRSFSTYESRLLISRLMVRFHRGALLLQPFVQPFRKSLHPPVMRRIGLSLLLALGGSLPVARSLSAQADVIRRRGTAAPDNAPVLQAPGTATSLSAHVSPAPRTNSDRRHT